MFSLFISSIFAANIKYGIVVDAGSSGTRGFLYTWEDTAGIPDVQPVRTDGKQVKIKSKIRLASAAKDPNAISDIFTTILDKIKPMIPANQVKDTPIYIFATAGMRLLSITDQERVLDATYDFVKNYGFITKRTNIRVIPGVEEGVYGWLSVNHLLGIFKENKPTIGAMDLGGASFQIALEVNESDKYEESLLVRLGNRKIRIFSHSYLGYGVDVSSLSVSRAIAAVKDTATVENPCLPSGYSIKLPKDDVEVKGTGNFDKCTRIIKKILIDGPHFETVNIPGLANLNKFVGMANLYFVNGFLNLNEDSTLENLKKAGTDYCSIPWNTIEEKYKNNPALEYAPTYCYCAAYQHTLLTKGFGFKDGIAEIRKLDEINGVDLSWAIGAMVAHVSDFNTITENSIPIMPILIANIFAFIILLPIYTIIGRKFRPVRYVSITENV